MPGFKDQMKGFPTWQIIVICIMRFSEPLTFTSLFPYVYFMIRDFEIAKDEPTISTYAGYLSSSFALTQVLFSMQWGVVSDRIGRKKVLIMGLTGSAISILTFGFAPNFYVALGARSFLGAVNGNIAVLRTSIGELVTERRHQAFAFSTLPLVWSIGSIIGPLIGGSSYLTRPSPNSPYHKGEGSGLLKSLQESSFFPGHLVDNSAKMFSKMAGLDDWHEKFITKYPYALSNIVVAIFLITSALCGFLFLEETHYKIKYNRDLGLDWGDKLLSKLGFKMPPRPWHSVHIEPSIHDSDSEESLLYEQEPQQLYASTSAGDDQSIQSIDSFGPSYPITRRTSNALVRRYSSISVASRRPNNLHTTFSRISGVSLSRTETRALANSKWSDILTPGVLQTVAGIFFISFHNVVYGEFLPVFLAGEIMPEKLKFPFHISGGFGLDSDFIGHFISITGITGVVVVLLVFPFLDRNFKAINNYRGSIMMFPILYAMIPFYIFTLPQYNAGFSPNTVKYLFFANGILNQFCTAVAFPQIMLLVHRSAPAKHRAFINGTSLTFGSAARFIAPLSWGYIMTYFDKINYGCVTWFILSGITLIAWLQSFWMEDYDEDLKDET